MLQQRDKGGDDYVGDRNAGHAVSLRWQHNEMLPILVALTGGNLVNLKRNIFGDRSEERQRSTRIAMG